jgi:hypothetical protein
MRLKDFSALNPVMCAEMLARRANLRIVLDPALRSPGIRRAEALFSHERTAHVVHGLVRQSQRTPTHIGLTVDFDLVKRAYMQLRNVAIIELLQERLEGGAPSPGQSLSRRHIYMPTIIAELESFPPDFSVARS